MSEFRASNCSQTRDEVALGPEMPATGKKGGGSGHQQLEGELRILGEHVPRS